MGTKKPSNINEVLLYYNLNNLLKKEKKIKAIVFPTLSLQLVLVLTGNISLFALPSTLLSLSASFLVAS